MSRFLTPFREYALMVEGCPFVLATAGCPGSFAPLDPDDPGWDSAAVLPGALGLPGGQIDTRMSPPVGTLEAGTQTFTIHDVTMPSPYAGKLLATYFGTKHPSEIPSTAVTSTITASSTSFVVASASGLTAGQVVWIDQEAIQIGTPSGTTIPITARGVYGSRKVDHRTSTDGRLPEVWGEFPGFDRRRVVLYWVESGFGTVIWRGYCREGLETAPSGSDYQLSCQHAWERLKDQRAGVAEATTRLVGFDMAAVIVGLRITNVGGNPDSLISVSTWWQGPQQLGIVYSPEDLLTQINATIRSQLGSYATGAAPDNVFWSVSISNDRISVTFAAGGIYRGQVEASLTIAGQVTKGDRSVATIEATDRDVSHVEATLPPACRTLWVSDGSSPSNAYQNVPVDNLTGMPATWASVTWTQDGVPTYIKPVLRAPYGDNAFLVIEPAGQTNDPPTVTGCSVNLRPATPGPINTSALGVVQFSAKSGEATRTNPVSRVVFVTQPTTLVLTYRINTLHWLYALRFAVFLDSGGSPIVSDSGPLPDYLLAGGRETDWDWSGTRYVVRATAGIDSRREWYLDGTTLVGALVQSAVALAGCAVMVRGRDVNGSPNAKLAIWPIAPPVPTSTLAATLTSDDCLADKSSGTRRWSLQRGSIRNAVRIETGTGKILVVDARSQQRYGQATELEVKTDTTNTLAVAIPLSTLAVYVLGRVLGLWSEPIYYFEFNVQAHWAEKIVQGDYVRLSRHWFFPDGLGTRGFTLSSTTLASSARLIGQVVNLTEPQKGKFALTVGMLVWGLRGFAGYSPCARVSALLTNVITLSKSYLTAASSTKNYDGSDPSSGDGGASKFAAGYAVRLVLRDSTTSTVQAGLVVQSVSGNTVTLTTTVPTSPTDWYAAVLGGAMVDLEFDHYTASATQDAQRGYAWIGGESTGTIAGTSDPANRWAP